MINLGKINMGMHREQPVATDGYAMALEWPNILLFSPVAVYSPRTTCPFPLSD
jgi:hypothetical protein